MGVRFCSKRGIVRNPSQAWRLDRLGLEIWC
jgi:hypothetical protein